MNGDNEHEGNTHKQRLDTLLEEEQPSYIFISENVNLYFEMLFAKFCSLKSV